MILKRFSKVTAVIVAMVCVFSFAACSKSPSAKVTVEGNKFMVDGKELWINGVNTPWHNWNDFNGSMDEKYWDDTFAQLASDGINATRIWVNCEGENIVRLTKSGSVLSINEGHWTDLDKLFEIAEKHKVYIMATLTSFDHMKGESQSALKWRMLMSSKENSDDFAEKYVKVFTERYKDEDYLFSIDIMNEPDWIHENEDNGQIEWDNISYFLGKAAATIHENSDILVTVGMGIVKYNSAKYDGDMVSDEYLQELTGNENAYLDFYSPHYYMWQKPWYGFPFDKTPEEFGIDTTKPVMIGEAQNDEVASGMDLTTKYKNMYDNGWTGMMVWMQPEEDGSLYRYDLTKEATNAMAEYIEEKIYPIGK